MLHADIVPVAGVAGKRVSDVAETLVLDLDLNDVGLDARGDADEILGGLDGGESY